MDTRIAHRTADRRNSLARLVQRRIATIHSVPARIIVLTAVASYVAQLLAILQGWPLWAVALATLVPWIPLITTEMVWTYRHYHWLALFYVLIITHAGHFLEHVIQMVQIHLLNVPHDAQHGLFSPLDTEWVHFIANAWVLVAVAVLLVRFRSNIWLWITLPLAVWHQVEHTYIMTVFLRTGMENTPGLLSSGGAIAGGLPLLRPDLHFIYNVLVTAPLVIAFRLPAQAHLQRVAGQGPPAPERGAAGGRFQCRRDRAGTPRGDGGGAG